ADLSEANLSGAYLGDALCDTTIFANVDLSEVRGLDSIGHRGPSTIGIDTLFRSHGKIPEGFLRGCGVPETLIAYLPSIVGAMKPIQFYSCFISYSTKNQDFAERLHSKMRDMGLRVWFAPEDVQGGKKLHEQIDEAIRAYDKLLLVLSPESMNSEWVRTEIRKARRAEGREKRRKLFPIRLVDFETIRDWECFDADSGKDLGVEIREYFIPDFSNWKDHDAFELALASLLKDLKAEESTGAKPV
ncbi:MAG: TIR domain-containing protein, partial [Isosphaeraceae bacterium]